MNKSALKNGMHVKLRDGSIREYYKGYFIGVEYNELGCIDFYDIDLKHNTESELDIMEVFDEDNNTIWEREEVDWSKVPVGTKVLVSANEIDWFTSYFIKKLSPIEDTNFYVINIKGELNEWEYCKLAEEPKEEVTFYDVNKKMDSYCEKNNKSCDQACGPCVTKYILDNYDVTRKDNK